MVEERNKAAWMGAAKVNAQIIEKLKVELKAMETEKRRWQREAHSYRNKLNAMERSVS